MESPKYFGSDDVPTERYTSREWHRREVDQLWSKVWQFACREEHIPEAGDYIVYDIAELSFLVVRQDDGTIKAYPNACLHRGRQLKEYDGHCSEIRCAFHGFAWKLDGDLQRRPGRLGLPARRSAARRLHAARGERRHVGRLRVHQPRPRRSTTGRPSRRLDRAVRGVEPRGPLRRGPRLTRHQANWKIAQEAFCEAYHVNATHPQILTYLGDVNSQVDVFENCARVITPGGTPSPLLGDTDLTENDMARGMLDVRVDHESPVAIEEGQTARAVLSQMARERWRPIAGDMVDQMSDSEMMDSIDYTVFPNFHPWGAFNRIVYRFRPNGDDHRSAIMECFLLSPFKGERPPPATETKLGADDPWTSAPELGMLAKVFEQDVFNMAKVQKGLETTRKPGATFSNYQESKIRWLHTLLGEWVNGDVPVTVGTGAKARTS